MASTARALLIQHSEDGHPTSIERENSMLYYALVFLVVGLIAGVLGMSGVAAVATQIAWILFIIGVVLLVVHFVTGRRTSRVP
jgi:uncharacterized membrane protein YtjA (UPF0391 family)